MNLKTIQKFLQQEKFNIFIFNKEDDDTITSGITMDNSFISIIFYKEKFFLIKNSKHSKYRKEFTSLFELNLLLKEILHDYHFSSNFIDIKVDNCKYISNLDPSSLEIIYANYLDDFFIHNEDFFHIDDFCEKLIVYNTKNGIYGKSICINNNMKVFKFNHINDINSYIKTKITPFYQIKLEIKQAS